MSFYVHRVSHRPGDRIQTEGRREHGYCTGSEGTQENKQ